VQDFNSDAATIAIRKSKSGKPRRVVLTPEGADLFGRHCSGRSGPAVMFRHANGTSWNKSEQARPMRNVRGKGKAPPPVVTKG
jgi:hypothetical protein